MSAMPVFSRLFVLGINTFSDSSNVEALRIGLQVDNESDSKNAVSGATQFQFYTSPEWRKDGSEYFFEPEEMRNGLWKLDVEERHITGADTVTMATSGKEPETKLFNQHGYTTKQIFESQSMPKLENGRHSPDDFSMVFVELSKVDSEDSVLLPVKFDTDKLINASGAGSKEGTWTMEPIKANGTTYTVEYTGTESEGVWFVTPTVMVGSATDKKIELSSEKFDLHANSWINSERIRDCKPVNLEDASTMQLDGVEWYGTDKKGTHTSLADYYENVLGCYIVDMDKYRDLKLQQPEGQKEFTNDAETSGYNYDLFFYFVIIILVVVLCVFLYVCLTMNKENNGNNGATPGNQE